MKIEGIGIRKILPIYLPTAKRERKCFCDSVTSQVSFPVFSIKKEKKKFSFTC